MPLSLRPIIFAERPSRTRQSRTRASNTLLGSFRGKRGFAAKRILLFTNAATPFSDHGLKTILDSLRQQDIILDAIGPTWGQDDDDGSDIDPRQPPVHSTNEPRTTDETAASAHPTTNGHHHQSPRKPLTQQQQTNVRLINRMVNTTEGSLFTFRYV